MKTSKYAEMARMVFVAAVLGMLGMNGRPTKATAHWSQYMPKPPKTESEKAVYQIYKKSLEADRFFGQKKYDEAAAIYETSIAALKDREMRRSPGQSGYQFPIGGGELPNALKYGGKEYNQAAKQGLDALSYSGLMTKMLEICCQITGRKTSLPDVFLPDDSRLVSDSYREIQETRLPVPNEQWPEVVAKLEIATAKLEGVLKRHPDLKNDLIDKSSFPDVTGAKAIAEANQKLAQARPEMVQTGKAILSELPELVQHDLDMAIGDMDKMIKKIKAGEFIPAREADEMIGDRAVYLQKMKRLLDADYQQSGRQAMPNSVLQPLITKLDALRAAVDARAPLNSFPTNVFHDAGLEASLRKQVAQNDPKARVLKTAMVDSSWEITKNALGVPLYRRKSGYLLYKLPTEKWARLYLVTYQEDYAGGGSYAHADGAGTYGSVRWQKVQ